MYKFFLILLLTPSLAFSQTDEEYEQFVLSSSLPYELRGKLYDSGFLEKYDLNSKINPFYLRGDFNGDNSMDYAILVVDKSSNKTGIAVVFKPGTYELIGAGKSLKNRQMDDFWWMDAWTVYTDRAVDIGVGETEQLNLDSDAILAIKTESSSGIIYWNGTEFLWYQQGD